MNAGGTRGGKTEDCTWHPPKGLNYTINFPEPDTVTVEDVVPLLPGYHKELTEAVEVVVGAVLNVQEGAPPKIDLRRRRPRRCNKRSAPGQTPFRTRFSPVRCAVGN